MADPRADLSRQRDELLENQLYQLLCRLDVEFARATDGVGDPEPARLLAGLGDVARRTAEVADELRATFAVPTLSSRWVDAAREMSAAGSSPTTVAWALIDAVEAMFKAFEQCFAHRELADRWHQAYIVFLDSITQPLQKS